MGNMHGSSWWIGSCVVRLIDLIVARSAGEIGPLSFCSLRRTSFSRAALSVKSTLVGCGLQSAALFFTNAGGGGAGGGGGVGGRRGRRGRGCLGRRSLVRLWLVARDAERKKHEPCKHLCLHRTRAYSLAKGP